MLVRIHERRGPGRERDEWLKFPRPGRRPPRHPRCRGSAIRGEHAATNLAWLRKLALALLKREQSDPRMSIEMRRRRVGWDNDYLFTVPAAVTPPSSS